MKPNLKKLYNKIVAAEIGERVSTRLDNGIGYNQSILEILTQQGYVREVDYETYFEYGTCITYIIKLKEIKPPVEILHNIKIGEIFYNSWGYEQTNIDFYQVVAVAKKSIKLRQIAAIKTPDAEYGDRGTSMPDVGNFISEITKTKIPYLFNDKWRVKFVHGTGTQWDGKPKHYSSYA